MGVWRHNSSEFKHCEEGSPDEKGVPDTGDQLYSYHKYTQNSLNISYTHAINTPKTVEASHLAIGRKNYKYRKGENYDS